MHMSGRVSLLSHFDIQKNMLIGARFLVNHDVHRKVL